MTNHEERQKLSYLNICLIAALGFTTQSFAQDSDEESKIEKIEIIGQKQAYKGDFAELETPQSELTLDLDSLRNIGATDISEALDLSSSIARQNNFGGLWNSFAVRGFVGDENLPSNYLVNGFSAGRGFGGTRDLSGVEYVEVLKGPRAALFGRGEPGGTVNLVTKRPTFDTAGELRLQAGSYSTYRLDADYTTPISENVAVRFVGHYADGESFRDTIEFTRQGMSPSIAWAIDDNTLLSYELEYSDQEVPFDRGVIAIDGELGLIPPSRFLGEPGDGPMEADVLGHQIEFKRDLNEDWSTLVGLNYRETSLEGVATETGFGSVVDDEINRFRRSRDYDAVFYVFRAEVSGDVEIGGLRHRIITGIDTDKFENDQVFLRVRGDQYINVFDPVYGAYELPELLPNTDRVETQQTTGIYFQDQISLTNNIDIRLGIRFDDYEQELNNRRSESITNQTEQRLSPQFGVVYKLSDSSSLYAAYGENFRPLSGSDADGNGFEPNQSTSMEAGYKFTLNDGLVDGTITVFMVEQDNILVVDDPTAFTYAAIGKAESQGLEIDIVGEIAEGLSLWASYSYVDAKTTNSFFDPNFGYTVEAGSRLLNIPQNQFTAQLVKSTTIGGNEFEFGGSLIYVDDRNGYFGTDFELPSYTIIKAFASYQVTDELELRADVHNLLDEEYYLNSFADVWVQPGTPRSFTVSASYRF